ncbi:MAG: hypothetical protein WCH96_06715 [Betaproteobacteria bacterium]
MHDTIEFEKRGIPAVVIITEAFRNAALFQFRSKGMENHPYIELPHPVSNLSSEQMRALTLTYVDFIARQLKE